MKKSVLLLSAACTLLLSGCFDFVQEITINADGSGTLANTNDMSAMLPLAKQMGGDELNKAGETKMDTAISLADIADSIPELTTAEKEIVKKGALRIVMNMKDEKFSTELSIPFSSPSQIDGLNKISAKVLAAAMKDEMKNKVGDSQMGGAEMPDPSSVDDYFITDYSNGVLERKLNKEKYASLAGDEYLKGMKEAGNMGMAMKSTTIFNLPRPAVKAEGKGIKLSADKKKVTIAADIDDLYDDPSRLEFRIEY